MDRKTSAYADRSPSLRTLGARRAAFYAARYRAGWCRPTEPHRRSLRETSELLMRGLGGDDSGRIGAEILQPHRKTPGIERMELHEARPSLIEENIIAEFADALYDHFGAEDRPVIRTLLDDRHAERPLAVICFGILD